MDEALRKEAAEMVIATARVLLHPSTTGAPSRREPLVSLPLEEGGTRSVTEGVRRGELAPPVYTSSPALRELRTTDGRPYTGFRRPSSDEEGGPRSGGRREYLRERRFAPCVLPQNHLYLLIAER